VDTKNCKYIDFYNKFKSHYNGDSGIDLFNESINIKPFQVGVLDFKIKCEMINIDTNNFVSYYLVPRSSISKTSCILTNSIGIIDAGYRGDIMAKIRNISNNDEDFKEGSYFQIISSDLKPIKINIVSQLSNTDRNDNAFGSTGN